MADDVVVVDDGVLEGSGPRSATSLPFRERIKRTRLSTEAGKRELAAASAAGERVSTLSRRFDVDPKTIRNAMSRPMVRDMIREEQHRLAALVPTSVDMIRESIDRGREAMNSYDSEEDSRRGSNKVKMAELGIKSAGRVLETAGILSSPCGDKVSVIIGPQAEELSPAVLSLIASMMPKMDAIGGMPAPSGTLGVTLDVTQG